ncbi:MAG: GNAT family N-acetyltransferase [Anaerolineae bacterium]|nr:GNAT family N-acetyltransferase [Anaerolineae bacterium]
MREYATQDRQALIAAIDAVCAASPWMLAPRFLPTPLWEHALRAPRCTRHRLLVVEDRAKVVGWCRLFPLALCNGPVPELELGIGLLPAYRHRGLGKALVGKAAAWGWEGGCQRIVLTTHPENRGALRFFQRLGFAPTGRQREGWIEMACQPDWRGGGTNV